MKHDIHKLPVVPYIIAERALWNVIEGDKRYAEFSPQQCAKLVDGNYRKLVEKAERIYANSDFFRKQLNDKRKDMRYTLEMFMEHWALGILNRPKSGYKSIQNGK